MNLRNLNRKSLNDLKMQLSDKIDKNEIKAVVKNLKKIKRMQNVFKLSNFFRNTKESYYDFANGGKEIVFIDAINPYDPEVRELTQTDVTPIKYKTLSEDVARIMVKAKIKENERSF